MMDLYILSFKYDYVEVDSLNDFGETDKLNRVISIKSNQSNEHKIDTLWHEIFHGVYDLMSSEENDGEERTVNALGRGVSSLYADPRNGEFLRFLNNLRTVEGAMNIDG